MENGERLKQWREESGVSQEAAARIFLVSVSLYQKWELGSRSMSEGSVNILERMIAAKENRNAASE